MRKALSTFIFACVAALTLSGCDEDGAKRSLADAGYSDIKMTGYVYFGCGRDDMFHNAFVATGPTGRRVSGVVCSGPLKGYTIRTF